MVEEMLLRLVEWSRGVGWRALFVYRGDASTFNDIIEQTLSKINGDVLCISKDGGLSSRVCSRAASYRHVRRLLGREYDVVIFYLEGASFWPGNLVAESIEFVRAGGLYAIQIPYGLDTLFTRYFMKVACNCKNSLIVDGDRILHYSLYRDPPRKPERPRVSRTGDKLLDALLNIPVNVDQYRVLVEYPKFLKGQAKLYFIHGDRGRGKSAMMGVLAAYTMASREGSYTVTAYSLESVQTLFSMAAESLRRLGILDRVYKRGGLIFKIRSSNGSILAYREPWRIQNVESKPLFIDEAAAVGVARVRRWYNSVGKLVASSTIHGYEGSGRALLKTMKLYFHRTIYMELRDPIRYYPGDPLEEFLYKLFHLDAEPIDMRPVPPEGLVYRRIDINELVEDYDLLRKVYGLLVTAHYRNEPDDLVAMIDGGFLEHRILATRDGDVVCVVQLREEHFRSPTEILESLKGMRGVSVLDKVARWGLIDQVVCRRLWRIVRIAVVPGLQRRGYGSMMLRLVEDEAKRRGIDFVGAIFSGLDIIPFWTKNGYLPVYLSPRYNKITGEKNLAVVKPLTKESMEVTAKAYRSFMYYLSRTAHILYRDVSIERIRELARHLREGIEPRRDDILVRLRLVNEGILLPEQVLDAIVDHVWEIYSGLDDYEKLVFIARVLQGKTVAEISRILKKPIDVVQDEVERMLFKAASLLYKRLLK